MSKLANWITKNWKEIWGHGLTINEEQFGFYVTVPLRGKYIGFLDDLFVDPEHRGKKIGEKIISELKSISEKNKWGLIRWITRNDNKRAKSLYDKVSEKTTWDTYELK